MDDAEINVKCVDHFFLWFLQHIQEKCALRKELDTNFKNRALKQACLTSIFGAPSSVGAWKWDGWILWSIQL